KAEELSKEEALYLGVSILEKNAQEFRDIYELSLDAALSLLGMPVEFDKQERIKEELVDDALHWVGGACNYGKWDFYPEGARLDKRFQAIHFVRAATYYIEYYILIKTIIETLKA